MKPIWAGKDGVVVNAAFGNDDLEAVDQDGTDTHDFPGLVGAGMTDGACHSDWSDARW